MKCRDCGAEVSEYDISCEVCGCIDFIEDGVEREEEATPFNPIPPSSPPTPPPMQQMYQNMGNIPTPIHPNAVQGGGLMQGQQPMQMQGQQPMQMQGQQAMQMQGQMQGYGGQQPTIIVMPQQPTQVAEAAPAVPAPTPVAPTLAPPAQDTRYQKKKLWKTIKNVLWYGAILVVFYYIVFVYFGYTPQGIWEMLTGEVTKVPPAMLFQDGGL